MSITRKMLNDFRADFDKAMSPLAEKYGLKIKSGKITYGELDFTMKFDALISNSEVDGERAKFEQFCSQYGFTAEDYKGTFTLGNKTFELVGFNPSRPKNDCTIRCITDGKTYLSSSSSVRMAMGKPYKINLQK